MIRISAFRKVPDFAKGLVRDLRVRWALEEAGLRYEQRLIGPEDQASPDYRALQPFGQVPSYEEAVDGERLHLFESGAIVLHIGERCETLLPSDPAHRAEAVQWLLAALSTIEPPIRDLVTLDVFCAGQDWTGQRRPEVVAAIRRRLAELAAALGDKPFLGGDRFTAGDLMMTTVLRILRHTDLVAEQPNLAAFVARCEARPAFRRALAAQMAAFED